MHKELDHKIDNLIATVDFNGQQIDGPTKEVMDVRDLNAKSSSPLPGVWIKRRFGAQKGLAG